MKNKTTNIIAVFLLLFLFFVSFFSILDDTLTYDETAHIVAGYSYLTERDMRVNPEHPPLIKNIAAAPLLLLNLNFPNDSPNWTQESPPRWWVQFDLANDFIYQSGNNPDRIMLFSRTAMILFMVFSGWFLFYFTKKRYDNKTALIALFLFSFSPTIIAHGRLANTDMGAAFGALFSFYFWMKFLEKPNKKNVFLSGIAFGIALVLKFSLVLLIPLYIVITIIYASLQEKPFRALLKYGVLAFLCGVIGMLFVVFPLYQYHVYDYPAERQARDAEFILETFGNRFIAENVVLSSEKPFLRPFAQYFLGLFTAMQRVDGGNTTYFLGEISTEAWMKYFPVVYLIKETITLHILTFLSFLIFLYYFFKNKVYRRLGHNIEKYYLEFSMLVFILIYWATSITSNLNIGVRHLLPVFPFTFILIAVLISKLKLKFISVILLLFLFQAYSVLSVYPHFLAYFNETVGVENGYKYVVDSNLDWGQDLKRLNNWFKENNIEFAYIDYFGGGDLDYHIGEGRYARWDRHNDYLEFPKNNYLAVSVNELQGGRGFPGKGFDQSTSHYLWLNSYEPIEKIGHSIFVYYIPDSI